MIGLYVTVPVACFRKGLAREYLETEILPPPSTCYGFLLSLVGEMDRSRHVGVRISPSILGQPDVSVVLRTIWRLKEKNCWIDPNKRHHIVASPKKTRYNFIAQMKHKWPSENVIFEAGMGCGSNARPDYQQLLTNIELIVWLDSTEEQSAGDKLEKRVCAALDRDERGLNPRFGGLSMGESTHLVDEVAMLCKRHDILDKRVKDGLPYSIFLLKEHGCQTFPVWVDHVGSANTVYVVGDIEQKSELSGPPFERMPCISNVVARTAN